MLLLLLVLLVLVVMVVVEASAVHQGASRSTHPTGTANMPQVNCAQVNGRGREGGKVGGEEGERRTSVTVAQDKATASQKHKEGMLLL